MNYVHPDPQDTTNFHLQVDRVARLMCEELQLNPEEQIYVEPSRVYTPYEGRWNTPPIENQQWVVNSAGQQVFWPTDGNPPYVVANGQQTTVSPTYIEPKMQTQRWRMFRREAALALASFRAVNKFILCENADPTLKT